MVVVVTCVMVNHATRERGGTGGGTMPTGSNRQHSNNNNINYYYRYYYSSSKTNANAATEKNENPWLFLLTIIYRHDIIFRSTKINRKRNNEYGKKKKKEMKQIWVPYIYII